MKHRNWARFLGLTAACAASLCLGAFLSYQAAMQQEAVGARAADNVAEAHSAIIDLAANDVPPTKAPESAPAVQPAAVPAPPPDRRAIVASLESDAPPVFSPSNALASPLSLRMSDDAMIEEASLHESDIATPTNPQSLPVDPTPPEAEALFHGKPAPLPPARPTSLSAALAVTPPAPVESNSAAPQQVAALPVPPPIPGIEPAPVVSAPSAPVVKATSAAASVAAASAPGSFPGIANALAAVTASVGGVNAAVTPGQPPVLTPGFPDGGASGFKKGSPVYVRIFKKEGVLELWLKRGDTYALYKSYPVCKWSGQLGPKTRQADYQSPEGFYSVSARQLNPNSKYHLAFDIGYPNAYDRRQGSTGNAVMVHGDCKSVGCFAMTNAGIDEIYGIVEAALRNGQHEVPVHIFPFRMTEEAIARESAPKQFMAFLAPANAAPHRDWSGFWRNLKQGYDMFERSHQPPVAYACGDRYDFGAAGQSCSRIAGW